MYAIKYYLNRYYQYGKNKLTNSVIKFGLYHCMDRINASLMKRGMDDLQLVAFRSKEDFLDEKKLMTL